MSIVGYIVCVIIGLFGLGAFLFACEQNREWRKAEKQIKAEEKKANEIITDAENKKADARTGDHERDINFMADVLHDYANKK
jgi:hypothetical protein